MFRNAQSETRAEFALLMELVGPLLNIGYTYVTLHRQGVEESDTVVLQRKQRCIGKPAESNQVNAIGS